MSALEDLLQTWEATKTRLMLPPAAARLVREALAKDAAALAAEEAPTQRMAPLRDTVLRRPPTPEVRELRGADLLRALADELERDGLGGDQR